MSKGWWLLWQDPHLLLIGRADVGLPGGLPSTSQPRAHEQRWLLPSDSALGPSSLLLSQEGQRGLGLSVGQPMPSAFSGRVSPPPIPSTTTPSGAVWPPVPTDLVTGASLFVPCNIGAPALLPLLARTNWQHLLQTTVIPGRSPGTGAPSPLLPGAHGPHQGPPAWPRGLPKSRGCGGKE